MKPFFFAFAVVIATFATPTFAGELSPHATALKSVEVLVFKSESCGPCRRDLPQVQKLMKRGVRVRLIDVDKHPEIAEKYRVKKLPFYVVERNGTEIKRARGILSILAFLGWLFGLIF